MKYYRFTAIFLENSLLKPAFVGIDQNGNLAYLSEQKPITENIENIHGAVLPGFQNAHSHAFQYGMAGMAEIHEENTADDFWTWREAMYNCALSYSPDDMKQVAVNLYSNMLRNGYTHVAEFHYVHHDTNGKPYNNLATTGEKLVEAAAEAGIRITLVPIFYQQGNFGKAASEKQRRFISPTIDEYFKLLESSKRAITSYKHATLGFGVHSLRAVNTDNIIQTFEQGDIQLPFHLHAAEQLKEIEDCQAFLGQRPVEWLLDHLPLTERCHLVHCTHMTGDEIQRLAATGANVVLCPSTEGSLGDGIFSFTKYKNHQGLWSIGTDSQIQLNPLEDLRWLDYQQRLTSHKRNTYANGAKSMINTSWMQGKKAMGQVCNDFFELGKPFDAVLYDMNHPVLAQANKHLLPAILYHADSSMVIGTVVNGQWVYKRN